jgi:UDP-N-acetylmuramoylalanine--D-glutamate ligase
MIDKRLLDDVKNKRIAILGLGVSNLPLVRMLVSEGQCESITVYDKKSIEEMDEEAKALAALGVNFVCGFDNVCGDMIFRSPGFRPDRAELQGAIGDGAILTSEMEKLLQYTPSVTFGVTGSDGKTTTTTLTGMFLSKMSKTYVGGNLGVPLLDKCDEMTEADFVALELSSFQLMNMPYAPINAAITNITPNHMDWHIDEAEYAGAKYNIVGENTKRLVVNAECKQTLDFGMKVLSDSKKEVIFFSSKRSSYVDVIGEKCPNAKLICIDNGNICLKDGEKSENIIPVNSIILPGMHNVENYMTAIALTYGYVDKSVYKNIAESFTGVDHRLQLIRTLNGVDYYNSSIDSSPTRTAAALSALAGRDIVVICGGYDKNLDYAPLAEALIKRARAVVLTGATAEKIKKALNDDPDFASSGLTVVMEESFEGAVAAASALGREGGCVLLSPASASFDRFKNFAERGKYFCELVLKL